MADHAKILTTLRVYKKSLQQLFLSPEAVEA